MYVGLHCQSMHKAEMEEYETSRSKDACVNMPLPNLASPLCDP